MPLQFCRGCAAGLSDVSSIIKAVPPDETPSISGSRGALSAKKSEAWITRLESKTGPTDLIENNASLMETLSGHKLTAGNRATLLIDDPATSAAMSRAIEEAKETFKFEEDEIGRRFADLLLAKKAPGSRNTSAHSSKKPMRRRAHCFEKSTASPSY